MNNIQTISDHLTITSREAPNNEKAYTTTKFTPKGITWVAGEWGKYKLAKGQA